jgi:hypothetical protein
VCRKDFAREDVVQLYMHFEECQELVKERELTAELNAKLSEESEIKKLNEGIQQSYQQVKKKPLFL